MTQKWSRRQLNKLLVELKRVYPQDTPALIDNLPSRKNRNWCRKVLDYELEPETDDEEEEEEEAEDYEPKQPDTHQDYHPRPVINNNKMPRPITPEKATLQDYRPGENRSAVSTHHKMPSEHSIEDNMTKVSNMKPQIASAKSKPFDVRDTPKKKNHFATPNMKTKNLEDKPIKTEPQGRLKSNFASDRESHAQHPKYEEIEPKLLSNTHVFEPQK